MHNLKWWFIFCASIAGLVVSYVLGWVHTLWTIDETKLSFAVIALYFLSSGFVGYLTIKATKDPKTPSLIENAEACNYASELMMRMAIMGTALGFFFMFGHAFGNATAMNMKMVTDAAKGMGTICLVTFVGVLCSSLLSLQLQNLRYLVRD